MDQSDVAHKFPEAALKALQALGLEVQTLEQELRTASRDASLYQGNPVAVIRFPDFVRNETSGHMLEETCKKIFEIAQTYGLPLTFAGARTSVAGQAVNQDGMLVDMSTFVRCGELIETLDSSFVETEPGVILDRLNVELRSSKKPYEHSLDLSSSYMATIGGTIMNNGGGILATKYGSARDNVVDLKIVLPTGRSLWSSQIQERGEFSDIYHELRKLLMQAGPENILNAMPRLRKNASGYNLRLLAEQAASGQPLDVTQLFVGSEGTLGTLLHARIKVRPVAVPKVTAFVFFHSLAEMSQAVEEILQIDVNGHVVIPRALEVISGSIFGMINELHYPLPDVCMPPLHASEAALLIEYDDAADIAQAALDKLQAICVRHLPSVQVGDRSCFRLVNDQSQRSDFWRLRKDIVKIINIYGGQHDLFAPPIIEDIGVPISHLGTMIDFLQDEMKDKRLRSAIFGHAGDGNLHVRPLLGRDAEQMELARHLMDTVYQKVVSLGGTISSEHGDGRLRTPYLELQYGPAMTTLFKRIKELFDPNYILNPGIKVPVPNLQDGQSHHWDTLGFLPSGGGRASLSSEEDVVQ